MDYELWTTDNRQQTTDYELWTVNYELWTMGYGLPQNVGIDALTVPDKVTIHPSLLDLPTEGAAFQGTPATAAFDAILRYRPRLPTYQGEVGPIAFTDEAAILDVIETGRIVTHQFYDTLQAKHALIRQTQHSRQGELHHRHTAHGFETASLLLAEQMGSMVCGNGADTSVGECLAKGIPVNCRLDGGIAFDASTQRLVVGIREEQMRHTGFRCDVLVTRLEEFKFLCGGNMRHM